MVTKREYLIQKGLAKAGRGKFSNEAREEIVRAAKSGIKFSDSTAEKAKAKAEALERREAERDERAKARAENAKGDVPVVADPRHDRPTGQYTFRNPDGSLFKRLHTNACAKCNYSFQWCYCLDGPTQFPYPYVGGEVYATLAGVPGRMVITTDDVPEKQPQQGLPRKGRRKGKAKAA